MLADAGDSSLEDANADEAVANTVMWVRVLDDTAGEWTNYFSQSETVRT